MTVPLDIGPRWKPADFAGGDPAPLFHLGARKSKNRKTGPIFVSTSARSTCATSCGLHDICYAETGFHLRMHWDKVSAGARGDAFGDFADRLASLPAGEKFRHNQAGDLPGAGDQLDRAQCMRLADATSHLDGWTYTHKPATGENLEILDSMRAAGGLTVNLSADNLADADRLLATGFPVVAVVAENHPARSRTPAGALVAVCPEQTGGAPNCKECMLCARPARRVVVAFRKH